MDPLSARLPPLVLLCLLMNLATPAARAAPLSPQQRSLLTGAERHDRQGWIYLRIQGEPPRRGFQYGYLLAPEIAESLRVRREMWRHGSGMDWAWLVERAARLLAPRVDAESLAELQGMSEGLLAAGRQVLVNELIAYNGYFELSGYYWPRIKKQLESDAPELPKQACSSFIATGGMTRDHGVVLGHNTMFPYPEADANVILDVVPPPGHGHRILMQAFPGWIHSGTDFFVTDAGLVGSETTIAGFHGFDPGGVPEFVRFRRATQDAGSIDEWSAIMQRGNNGGYANAWLLGDVRTGEIARLELGLKHVRLEKKKDGYFLGSNVAEDLQVLRFETDVRETDIRLTPVARRVRWKQLMQQYAGRIDADLARRMEADHYDTYLQQEHPGARSLCSHAHEDPKREGMGNPYNPSGTFDAKVVDTQMARRMEFAARWGAACGTPFDAAAFLAAHPQFDWLAGILKSRPAQPWTLFRAGEQGTGSAHADLVR